MTYKTIKDVINDSNLVNTMKGVEDKWNKIYHEQLPYRSYVDVFNNALDEYKVKGFDWDDVKLRSKFVDSKLTEFYSKMKGDKK